MQVINGEHPRLDLIRLNTEQPAIAADIQAIQVTGYIHNFRYGDITQPEIDAGSDIGMDYHVVAGPIDQRFKKACGRYAPGIDVKTFVQVRAAGQRRQQCCAYVRR